MNYIDILPIVYPLAKHARRHDGACLGAIGKKNTRDPVLVKSQRYRENSGRMVYSGFVLNGLCGFTI